MSSILHEALVLLFRNRPALALTADEAVARWVAQPIEIGQPSFTLTPFVLGPSAVPIVTDAVAAEGAPELAVLSAMAHGRDPADIAVAIAHAALGAAGAARGPDEERAKLYADLVLSRLGEAAKAALEALMLSGKYEYQNDFAKKYIAVSKAEGEAEGEAEGKAEAVLAVLQARGVPVPSEAQARIRACRDIAELDRWITRALAVESVDDLLASGPQG